MRFNFLIKLKLSRKMVNAQPFLSTAIFEVLSTAVDGNPFLVIS